MPVSFLCDPFFVVKSLSCVAPRRGLLRCARSRGLKRRGYRHGVAPRRGGKRIENGLERIEDRLGLGAVRSRAFAIVNLQ
jgi:hypothetical protein